MDAIEKLRKLERDFSDYLIETSQRLDKINCLLDLFDDPTISSNSALLSVIIASIGNEFKAIDESYPKYDESENIDQ